MRLRRALGEAAIVVAVCGGAAWWLARSVEDVAFRVYATAMVGGLYAILWATLRRLAE